MLWPGLATALDAGALNEVVVSGQRPAVEQVAAVYEVDADAIALRGARSLDDAIELLPGLNVRTGGNGSPRVDVRGFRTRQVKLLLNGVPFGNTFDGQFDPTLIPAEDIERIKLTTGASSALYGDGAIGAVINVITRQATAGQHAGVHAEYGEGDFYRTSGEYSWGDGYGGVFFAGGRTARRGFPLADGFEPTTLEDGHLRANSDRERNHAYVNVYRELTPTLDVGGTFTYTRGGYGQPGTVVDNPADVFSNRPRWQRVDDQDTLSGQVSLNWDPDGPLANRFWGYINTLDETTNRYTDAATRSLDDVHVRGTFDDDARSRVVGAHDELTIEHGFGGALRLMAEARQEHFAQDCMTRDVPHLPPAPPPVPVTPPLATATSAHLDFNYLSTNNYGATNAAGANESIATLDLKNDGNGGLDFAFKSLHAGNFFVNGGSGPPIPGAYVSRFYFLPDPALDISQWQFVDNPATQATVGGAVNFAAPGGGDVINNYHFRGRVGWQRPGGNGGAANPLFDGETALWKVSGATLQQVLGTAAAGTGGRPNAFAAIELRQADANGFWGPSEAPTGGPGGRAVFLVAPTSATALVGPKPPDPTPVVNVAPPGTGCGSGGDGSGGGTPTRYDNVTFGLRPFTQDRALIIATTAAELSARPWSPLELVFGYAAHWFQRDDGSASWYGSWSGGASYALTHDLSLRFGAAYKLRMPSVQQLYDTLSGDPALKPERAMTYEVGSDWRGWRYARLGLTLFRSNVHDFIERDVQTETFANFQHYRFQGVEVTSHSEFAGQTTVDASYSFLDAVDRGETRVFNDLQYRPRHKFTLEAARRFETGTVASMQVMHVGEEMFFSRIGTPQERMLAPYTLVGARLAQEFYGKKLRVYVGASNLLDDNYAEAYGLPQAGRMVYGGVDLQLF